MENGEIFHLLNTVHLARLFQDARFPAAGLRFSRPGKQRARIFSYQIWGISLF
jgi:hypothetical protein